MSATSNLILFPRHVVTCSTAICRRYIVAGSIQSHARLDRCYIHNSPQYRALTELRIPSDTVLHSNVPLSTDTGARRSSDATISPERPDQPNNSPNQQTWSRRGGSLSQDRARGRSCLVTGATSGIGYEVTKCLALEGASHIRIVSRDSTRGEEAMKRIKEETDRHDLQTEVLQADYATSNDSGHAKISQIFGPGLDGWPPVDTAVLCAGISQSKLIIQTSIDDIDEIIKVNLSSNILLSRAFLTAYQKTSQPKATKRDRSTARKSEPSFSNAERSFCLVSISSLLAHKGGYGTSVYAASKLGLVAYNRALTVEAGAVYKRKLGAWPEAPSFRVNTVSPGYIDTPMTEGIAGEGKQTLTDQIPLNRFGQAEEVADAVMFLIGNEYANNCEINLDGGLSAT